MLGPKWGRVVTLSDRFDPRVLRKVRGGVLSAALHVGLLFVILSGGRTDGMHTGDTPTSMLVMLEAREANRRDDIELPPLEPAVPTPLSDEQLHAAIASLATPPTDAIAPQPAESTPPNELPTEEIE